MQTCRFLIILYLRNQSFTFHSLRGEQSPDFISICSCTEIRISRNVLDSFSWVPELYPWRNSLTFFWICSDRSGVDVRSLSLVWFDSVMFFALRDPQVWRCESLTHYSMHMLVQNIERILVLRARIFDSSFFNNFRRIDSVHRWRVHLEHEGDSNPFPASASTPSAVSHKNSLDSDS
eukprot:Gregarina_sp_Poly_1__4773@NODE_2546_length_2001_cov_83_612720_g1617_i0_p1_GENE_NODE_2546_length_2001_cov_83_612720_g1617_i0NODE_2546_length_2001_cov_83_612720_g1617_i0_p1_ORF_typecomplete_len177_score5_48_NODE_2546_length_2001_cov_83_612720_g1617_i0296826